MVIFGGDGGFLSLAGDKDHVAFSTPHAIVLIRGGKAVLIELPT